MSEQQPQDPASLTSAPQYSAPQPAELSLEELEAEIAQAEALVHDLNQRLKQTAAERR